MQRLLYVLIHFHGHCNTHQLIIVVAYGKYKMPYLYVLRMLPCISNSFFHTGIERSGAKSISISLLPNNVFLSRIFPFGSILTRSVTILPLTSASFLSLLDFASLKRK